MSDSSRSGRRRVVKLFGALLMAAGALIAVLSGLCSMAVLGTIVLSLLKNPHLNAQSAVAALPIVLLFGGIPIAIGVGVFILGRSLYRDH